MKNNPKNQSLDVSVVDGRLVISIGINTLVFSAISRSMEENYNQVTGVYTPKFIVSDPPQFSKDVAIELCREEEDGTTPVHKILDAAFDKVLESGTSSIKTPEDGRHWAALCTAWDPENKAKVLKARTHKQKKKRR